MAEAILTVWLEPLKPALGLTTPALGQSTAAAHAVVRQKQSARRGGTRVAHVTLQRTNWAAHETVRQHRQSNWKHCLQLFRDPIHDLVPFAIGYREAARALAAPLRGNAYPDYNGYPVLYLYRHSLELFLKAVVYRGARVMGLVGLERPNVPGLFSKHDLGRLLPAVRAIFRAVDWEWDGTPIGTHAEFENIVRQVDRIDPKSYAFRYPMSPSGEAHLPNTLSSTCPTSRKRWMSCSRLLEGAAPSCSTRDFRQRLKHGTKWSNFSRSMARHNIRLKCHRDGNRATLVYAAEIHSRLACVDRPKKDDFAPLRETREALHDLEPGRATYLGGSACLLNRPRMRLAEFQDLSTKLAHTLRPSLGATDCMAELIK
jgi:hypothetical protein